MLQTKGQIEDELQSFKNVNPDWRTDVKKGLIVASYNNRLAAFPSTGKCLLSIYSCREIIHRNILIISF